ncbi:hypothetical protein KAU11_10695, partial [Candidatus Babeliales bacterium]|nr:hypothetical protein [Candidatus Babeliales bacterium]
MSKLAAIGGASASGKSTAYCQVEVDKLKIEGLDPKETFILNVASKELPALGMAKIYNDLGHIYNGSDYAGIFKAITSKILPGIKKGKIKNIVLEDAQYLMSLDFFERRNDAGFTKFAKIGFSFLELLVKLKKLPGVYVFVLLHTEINSEGQDIGVKTIGRMLDEKFTLEGLWTTVLIAQKDFNRAKKTMEYKFRTAPAYKDDIAKSPL